MEVRLNLKAGKERENRVYINASHKMGSCEVLSPSLWWTLRIIIPVWPQPCLSQLCLSTDLQVKNSLLTSNVSWYLSFPPSYSSCSLLQDWGLRDDCPTPHLAKGNSPCSSGFAICYFFPGTLFSSFTLCLQPSSPLSVFPFIFSPSFLFFPPLSYWPLLLTLPHTTSFKSFFLDFPGSFSLSLFLSPLSVSLFFYNFKLFFATLFLNLFLSTRLCVSLFLLTFLTSFFPFPFAEKNPNVQCTHRYKEGHKPLM